MKVIYSMRRFLEGKWREAGEVTDISKEMATEHIAQGLCVAATEKKKEEKKKGGKHK